MVTEIPDDIRDKTYYHGVSDETTGEAIMREKTLHPPPDVGRGFIAPVRGFVYIAPSKKEVFAYAMGGIIQPGPDAFRGFSRGDHGYVFLIDGHDLTDIQPDEDSVGQMASDALRHKFGHWMKEDVYAETFRYDPEFQDTFGSFAASYLTDRERYYIMSGEAIWEAHIGKKLLKTMPDWLKIELIRRGANVANRGPLPIRGVYKFDRRKEGSIFAPENRVFRRPRSRQVHVRRHERRSR